MSSKESNLLRVSTINLNDDLRLIQQDASRKILYETLVTDLQGRIGGGGTPGTGDLIFRTMTVNSALDSTTDRVIFIDTDTAGSDLTLTLPTAASVITTPGQSPVFTVKKVSGAAFDGIIVTSGDQVDGVTQINLIGDQFPFVNLISDGANWWSW